MSKEESKMNIMLYDKDIKLIANNVKMGGGKPYGA